MAESLSESLQMGFLEQLYLGLPGVLRERPWVKAALPDWYPYVFRNQAEAVGWFGVLSERWKATGSPWQEGELERLRAWLRDRYSARNSYLALWARLEADRAERGTAKPGAARAASGSRSAASAGRCTCLSSPSCP